MENARIAKLLAPFLKPSLREQHRAEAPTELSPVQLQRISMYIDLLLAWNARVNLTAVREPEEVLTRHFGESIFAARHIFPKGSLGIVAGEAAPHVIDIGSGAGFPGLPIKIWAPHINLTLIESNQKKATFLREVIRKLEFNGFEVFAGRAEGYPGPKGQVVTLRAVERFEKILPVAAGLVDLGGRLMMLVGESQLDELSDQVPNVKWSEPLRLPLSSSRVLIIERKESQS
jgi:16S rRNA (guanine527-N7)-methyltransferase